MAGTVHAGLRPCARQLLELAPRLTIGLRHRAGRLFAAPFCNFGTFPIELPLEGRIRIGLIRRPLEGRGHGRFVMELLDAILNLFDAVSTAIGILVVWNTWVAPRRQRLLPPSRPYSDPDELDRFVRNATPGTTSGDTA